MNRPDPQQSRVRDIVAELTNIRPRIDELEKLKRQGPLLFTQEDVYATSWHPDQILREICVKNNITEAYFAERYKLYELQVLGKHPIQASNDRSNTVKALKSGYITYKRLIEVVQNVLGLKIIRISMELMDADGNTQGVKFNENVPENKLVL